MAIALIWNGLQYVTRMCLPNTYVEIYTNHYSSSVVARRYQERKAKDQN